MATVYGVTFDDVSAHPWDIAHTLRTEGDFVSVVPQVPTVNPERISGGGGGGSQPPKGWEHNAMKIEEAWAAIGNDDQLGRGKFCCSRTLG